MKLLDWTTVITCALLLVSCGRSGTEPVDKRRAADSRIDLGLAYLAEEQFPLAQQNLQRALDYAPRYYRSQLGMALYSQQVGANTEAATFYNNALQLALKSQDPQDDNYAQQRSVRNSYGAFLCSLGEYRAAHAEFMSAGKQYAKDVDSLENAGQCFLIEGRIEEAKHAFIEAVRKDPARGDRLLVEAEKWLEQKEAAASHALLDVYQQLLPVSAQSLWLQIRFAALDGKHDDVNKYADQLAQRFPHSQQYQQLLANEY